VVSVEAIELVGKSFWVVLVVAKGEIFDVLFGTVCMVVEVGVIDVWRVVSPTTEGVVIILLGTSSSRETDVIDGLTIVIEVINMTEVSIGRESDGAVASWRGNAAESNETDEGRLLP
jgi:hypothetical protein